MGGRGMKPGPDRDAFIRAKVYEGETLSDIGDMLGVTRERVRQIANRFSTPAERDALVRARQLRVHGVDWVCESCGKKERRLPAASHARTCRKSCRIETHGPYKWFNSHDGHWYVGVPDEAARRGRRRIRYARYLMEKELGRKLRRNEWVVLLDGDTSNFSRDNIAILTPSQAHPTGDRRLNHALRQITALELAHTGKDTGEHAAV